MLAERVVVALQDLVDIERDQHIDDFEGIQDLGHGCSFHAFSLKNTLLSDDARGIRISPILRSGACGEGGARKSIDSVRRTDPRIDYTRLQHVCM